MTKLGSCESLRRHRSNVCLRSLIVQLNQRSPLLQSFLACDEHAYHFAGGLGSDEGLRSVLDGPHLDDDTVDIAIVRAIILPDFETFSHNLHKRPRCRDRSHHAEDEYMYPYVSATPGPLCQVIPCTLSTSKLRDPASFAAGLISTEDCINLGMSDAADWLIVYPSV